MIDRRGVLRQAGLVAATGLAGGLAGGLGMGRALAAPVDPLAGVDPQLRAGAQVVLAMGAKLSPLTTARLPILREGGAAMAGPLRPDVPVEERKVPVAPGIPDVTVYVINAGKRPGGGPRGGGEGGPRQQRLREGVPVAVKGELPGDPRRRTGARVGPGRAPAAGGDGGRGERGRSAEHRTPGRGGHRMFGEPRAVDGGTAP